VVTVRYWAGSAWASTCSPDTGLRQLTLQVSSDDQRAVERLVIEVRKPCGLADPLCAYLIRKAKVPWSAGRVADFWFAEQGFYHLGLVLPAS
jgi:hypothetical protein